MSLSATITKLAISLLLVAAVGPVSATSNTNALLGASDPVVLELGEAQLASKKRSALVASAVASGARPLPSAVPGKVSAQRLPSQQARGFDWTTLISLSFGILGLLWIRRRSADL